jgi:LysR family transcriptional activator of nhaA
MAAYKLRHLQVFWVVGTEGSMSAAARRLGVSVQTVSSQLRDLERDLGYALLRVRARGVEPTPAGRAALELAEPMFQLAERVPQAVAQAAAGEGMVLRVGIADSLPKLLVRQLLRPVCDEGAMRLVGLEGEFDELLAELALHRLDIVLADRAAPPHPSLKLHSRLLGSAQVAWFAAPELARRVEGASFPELLGHLPLLMPTTHAALRARLEDWLARHDIRARVVGEFEDSALLASFGQSGMGAFAAPDWSAPQLVREAGLVRLGLSADVGESFYAISARRRIEHPALGRLVEAAAAVQAAAPG